MDEFVGWVITVNGLHLLGDGKGKPRLFTDHTEAQNARGWMDTCEPIRAEHYADLVRCGKVVGDVLEDQHIAGPAMDDKPRLQRSSEPKSEKKRVPRPRVRGVQEKENRFAPGFVYLMESVYLAPPGRIFKIGQSTDPRQRVNRFNH